jgi:hypothetical protein
MREIQAIVHPVVILNVLKEISELDQKKKTKKKFGCLLGFFKDNKINCTSDFILPFDEKSSNIIFFDQIFMEKMACMLKKINNKEKIVGWYNLGEKINQKHRNIHRIFFGYCFCPILIIFWTDKQTKGIFFEAFKENQKNQKNLIFFETVATKIGMLKSEEIVVYQILYNSNGLIYPGQYPLEIKWKKIVIFFSQYIRKLFQKKKTNEYEFHKNMMNFNKNQNLNFLWPSFFEKNLKDSEIERNILVCYLSSILKLIFSFDNFFFLSGNFR